LRSIQYKRRPYIRVAELFAEFAGDEAALHAGGGFGEREALIGDELVEAGHVAHRAGVADGPERHERAVRAADEDGAGEAGDALAAVDAAEAGLAGGEHGEVGLHLQARDLGRGEVAVLAA